MKRDGMDMLYLLGMIAPVVILAIVIYQAVTG